MTVVIDSSFDPLPSLLHQATVSVVSAPGTEAQAVAHFVTKDGELPEGLEADRAELEAAGFTGAKNQTLVLLGSPLTVLVGAGKGINSEVLLRDAVAAFTRAASESARLSVDLRGVAKVEPRLAAQVASEGAILARYRYDSLKSDPKTVRLENLELVVAEANTAEAEDGATRGIVLARAAGISRDLGNTPPRHLNATKFAQIAERLAPEFGFQVEVFDRAALMELGTGGLLGVNAGSAEEPRMVKVRYVPENAAKDAPHLALVGKGIMFDSGGVSLKPANSMHGMKFDMMGAGAILGAMTALRDLGTETIVTGWLMCTDNMLSGTATKIGDVLTIRGGKTVEVKNSDAEGRLVMADALVLANEEREIQDRRPDAVVDIATLTGNAMAALGLGTAAVFGNNDDVVEQLKVAAGSTDERIWRMPLDHRYTEQLKSNVADLSNIGGQLAGAITAALFLNEFVGDMPWGHLDIAATMESERDDLWRSTGSTGFGARLLAEFALAFEAPAVATEGDDSEGSDDSDA